MTVTLGIRVFANLVEEAHKRSIKIMLDTLFSIISATSLPNGKDVLKNEKNHLIKIGSISRNFQLLKVA